MERLFEIVEERKGILLGELAIIIGWIIYLVTLNQLNERLQNYYSESDGAILMAFKVVFSDQFSSIMWYLIFGIGFLIGLFLIPRYTFKQESNYGYYDDSTDNFIVGLSLSVINFILGMFVFTSLLAPILICIFIVVVVSLAVGYGLSQS